MCASLAYVELVAIATEKSLLEYQAVWASRLLQIESARVHLMVDDPAALTDAKRQEARVRLLKSQADEAIGKVREHLAYFTGSRGAESDLAIGSVPRLPCMGSSVAEMRFSALRDAVQLEHALSMGNRDRIAVESMIGTSSLGKALSVDITSGEKLDLLVMANFALVRARIEELYP